MKHPSIKTRLIFGSTFLVAIVLLLSKLAMYREVERSMRQEVDDELLYSATLLSKSTELEWGGVVYEWKEAMDSTAGLGIQGLFQLWDLKSQQTVRSPDLGNADLKLFHGELNKPVYETIQLADGRPARAVGFLHLPFTNEYGREEMRRRGKILDPTDYPQVIVCALDTRDLENRLSGTRADLLWSGVFTLLAVWLAVLLITRWSLRPLSILATNLLKRSSEVGTPLPEIPPTLPRELVQVTSAFRTTLERVETARAHEKDFALSAAHQLRTPIAGLNAILEQALARPREMENLLGRIQRAHEVVHQMHQTIEGLMQLARFRSRVDQAIVAPYQPVEVVRQLMVNHSHSEGPESRRQLKISAPSEDIRVAGDSRLFQVLASTLIENAFRHSPDNGRIDISMRTRSRDFILSIANDTDDFDPADSERLFRPFQRGKNTSVNSPGAGLGLALAKEISLCIGALLHLSSQKDGMVMFELTLPDAVQQSAS
ncbi:HAMP domain-containing sensor histidine kinase [Haloferula sp. BvORR071]|uniref:sensor histidine kinase n=1 Tax=Haloferula sp. BvORR071 TaxID=1396141 RepID=UPI000555D290|nr:HAMP domain-containing sensor histidine kinase [Haloferula sp. BvORR071]